MAGKTTEAVVAAIPIVGGPLAVVVATLFGFSYDRRLTAWREEVFDRIRALEEQGVSVQDLANDDAFLDALAQATRTAEAQSSEEKRRYLADALFNIGAGTAVGRLVHVGGEGGEVVVAADSEPSCKPGCQNCMPTSRYSTRSSGTSNGSDLRTAPA